MCILLICWFVVFDWLDWFTVGFGFCLRLLILYVDVDSIVCFDLFCCVTWLLSWGLGFSLVSLFLFVGVYLCLIVFGLGFVCFICFTSVFGRSGSFVFGVAVCYYLFWCTYTMLIWCDFGLYLDWWCRGFIWKVIIIDLFIYCFWWFLFWVCFVWVLLALFCDVGVLGCFIVFVWYLLLCRRFY